MLLKLSAEGLRSITAKSPLRKSLLILRAICRAPSTIPLLLAWLFFGVVLLARAAAGWRGRRAAIGTTLGFLCALASIAGYLLRHMVIGENPCRRQSRRGTPTCPAKKTRGDSNLA